MIQVTLKNINDKLIFGKYRGKSIQEIIEFDPQYILWLDRCNKVYVITKEVEDLCNNKINNK